MPTSTPSQEHTLWPYSIIILAGGQGRRLGVDKALLQLGSRTLLGHVLDRLAPLTDDLIVAIRGDQSLSTHKARIVCDLAPYNGVMAGIAAGLVVARHEWSLVVACDMPFVNVELVGYMNSQRKGHDVVVPQREVGLEPLHALYHRRCLAGLREAMEAGRKRAISFYETLDVRYLSEAEMAPFDPDGRSFFNINTPDDLVQARDWYHQALCDCAQTSPSG